MSDQFFLPQGKHVMCVLGSNGTAGVCNKLTSLEWQGCPVTVTPPQSLFLNKTMFGICPQVLGSRKPRLWDDHRLQTV